MYDVNDPVLPLSNTALHQMIIKLRVRLTLKGHEGQVWSAGYRPDGQRIVTASNDFTTAGVDGIVQIYTTDMDELLQIAESRVTRQLTAEEKEKYGVLGLN